MMAFLRLLLILLGACGILDTALVSTVSSMNMGVALPGILGAPLLLLGLLLPRLPELLPPAWVSAIKWLFLIGYGVLLLAFGITWGIIDQEARREPPPDLDVLIVLGAGLRNETPTRVLRQRLDTAAAYLGRNPRTIAIVSGGQGSGETIPEAEAMATYLLRQGLPEDRILLEPGSTSTEENFRYSYAIIQERFGADAAIGFVTTDFHVYRAGRVAKRQGIAACGLPAPDVWYISLNNHLRECLAIWAYAAGGKI